VIIILVWWLLCKVNSKMNSHDETLCCIKRIIFSIYSVVVIILRSFWVTTCIDIISYYNFIAVFVILYFLSINITTSISFYICSIYRISIFVIICSSSCIWTICISCLCRFRSSSYITFIIIICSVRLISTRTVYIFNTFWNCSRITSILILCNFSYTSRYISISICYSCCNCFNNLSCYRVCCSFCCCLRNSSWFICTNYSFLSCNSIIYTLNCYFWFISRWSKS
jgi:hypothetical protein